MFVENPEFAGVIENLWGDHILRKPTLSSSLLH
jgi:hypothetical protein